MRSGAANVAEALRMVPGLHVARAGSSQWAVASRGFNDQFANKLLVLIDGRSVYTPNFSGVWWDVQNLVMEDIERVEVIRGPGATLWGANAVNGVINIITKSAKDTQGSMLVAGAGTDRVGFGSVRHGGELGDQGYYRMYAKHDSWDALENATATRDSGDEWLISQAGFRIDMESEMDRMVTVQGDLYNSQQDQRYSAPLPGAPFSQTVRDDQTVQGGNVLARWKEVFSEGHSATAQLYMDYTSRDITFVDMENKTIDAELQHNIALTDWNQFSWGLGMRYIEDDLRGGPYLMFLPQKDERTNWSAFVQNKVTLVPEHWTVTLGSKFEYNTYTDFDWQPSARTAVVIDDSQTVWASVSHALRNPSRSARDLVNVVNPEPALAPALYVRHGSEDTDSEELTAYEMGYRIQSTPNSAVDISAFYNVYDNLIVNSVGTPFAIVGDPNFGNYTVIPVTLWNGGEADTYGFEMALNYEPFKWWKLAANYSFLQVDYEGNGNTLATSHSSTPEQQVHVRSYLQLANAVQWDHLLYYVDQIDPVGYAGVEGYWRLDTRVAWQAMDGLELSLVAQNLLDSTHPEFSPFLYNNTAQVGRSIYGKLRWEF